MAEINNQRKRSSICWRGRRESITDVRTNNHGYDVIVGGELFTDYLITSQTCHAKPKTQINRRRTLPAFFPLRMLNAAVYPKDFSPKVRTLWHCSRLRSGVYLWLIVVISVSKSTAAAISGLHCRALVMVSSEHKADSLIAKSEEAGGTVREIDVWAELHRDYSALVICIIVCPSWAVNQ